jgi:hypothetical protein
MILPTWFETAGPVVDDFDYKEIWLCVTDYTPGHPGQTSGPPERCYPPEDPEVEFYLAWNKGGPESPFLAQFIEDYYDEAGRLIEDYLADSQAAFEESKAMDHFYE